MSLEISQPGKLRTQGFVFFFPRESYFIFSLKPQNAVNDILISGIFSSQQNSHFSLEIFSWKCFH